MVLASAPPEVSFWQIAPNGEHVYNKTGSNRLGRGQTFSFKDPQSWGLISSWETQPAL